MQTVSDVRTTMELLCYLSALLTFACALYVTVTNWSSARYQPGSG